MKTPTEIQTILSTFWEGFLVDAVADPENAEAAARKHLTTDVQQVLDRYWVVDKYLKSMTIDGPLRAVEIMASSTLL